MKVYSIVEEYCSDGDIDINVLGVFKSKDDALNCLKKADETNMNMPHWSACKKEEMIVEKTDETIFRSMCSDSYYYNLFVSTNVLH